MEFAGGLTRAGSIERDREAEPFIAVALDLRSRAQVFLHTGRTFTLSSADLNDLDGATDDDDPDHEGHVQWNAGALMAFSRVTLAMELSLVTDGSPWRSGGERYLTPSITVPAGGPWEVGVGLPIGLNRRADRIGVAALAIFER